MKMLQCLMNKVIVDLMTSLSIGDDVRDHLWLIIVKSSEPVSEFGFRLVSFTHTITSFFECFLCLCVKGIGVGFHHMIGDIMSA